MRFFPRVLLTSTLALSAALIGCGGGSSSSTNSSTDSSGSNDSTQGIFAFARASGSTTSNQALSRRSANRSFGLKPRAVFAAQPEAGVGHIYLMDHHGAQGSEISIGASADYESIALSADHKKLVFCAYTSNGYYQIFTAAADGSNVAQLTNDPEDHWEAQFSPDGSQIVYVRGFGNLGLMSSLGGPEKTVDTDRFYIDHPILLSGGKILFEGFDSEVDALFAVNQDGTGLMSFLGANSPNPYYYEEVTVSADGTKIAVAAYEKASGNEDIFIGEFSAASIDTYGGVVTNLRKLTTAGPVAGKSFDPMFVDDRIVFVSFGDTEPVGAGQCYEIYSIKFDGSDLRRLTRNTDFEWFMVPYYYYSPY